ATSFAPRACGGAAHRLSVEAPAVVAQSALAALVRTRSGHPKLGDEHEVDDHQDEEHEQARHDVRRRCRSPAAPSVGVEAPARALSNAALHAGQEIDFGGASELGPSQDGANALLHVVVVDGLAVVLVRHPIFSPMANSTASLSCKRARW